MKVRIGRDFYDKKNDVIYSQGEITDVKEETALWIVRNSLGCIISNVRMDRPAKIDSRVIEESTYKDKMIRKNKTK